MSILAIAILAAIPVVGIVGSIAFMIYKHSKGMPTKKALKMQIATFAAIAVMATVFAFTASAASDNTAAAADDGAATSVSEQQEEDSSDSAIASGLKYLSAALSIGLAGIGGGLALAAGAPAAIAAMSENPKTFGKSIVLLALGEAVALYGLVIAFMILLGIGG
ncbi:MAG: ATP synthase subunit C [Clostridia bacterium]